MAGTTLAEVAMEQKKFAGWDGATFKYETKRHSPCRLHFFFSPVAQEALSKVMGSAGRGILGQGRFTVPKKSNLQRAASHSLVKA